METKTKLQGGRRAVPGSVTPAKALCPGVIVVEKEGNLPDLKFWLSTVLDGTQEPPPRMRPAVALFHSLTCPNMGTWSLHYNLNLIYFQEGISVTYNSMLHNLKLEVGNRDLNPEVKGEGGMGR